jgi:hypothetical protein
MRLIVIAALLFLSGCAVGRPSLRLVDPEPGQAFCVEIVKQRP